MCHFGECERGHMIGVRRHIIYSRARCVSYAMNGLKSGEVVKCWGSSVTFACGGLRKRRFAAFQHSSRNNCSPLHRSALTFSLLSFYRHL